MTRIRIEVGSFILFCVYICRRKWCITLSQGLLAAFPKLLGSDNKQHTYVETESVRYVFFEYFYRQIFLAVELVSLKINRPQVYLSAYGKFIPLAHNEQSK